MIPLLRLKTTDEDEAHSEQYYKSPTKNKKIIISKAKAETYLQRGNLYAHVGR